MTLRALRDRLSALQALLASLAVIAGGGMTWTSFGLAAALAAWAFYRPRPEAPSKASSRAWTLGVVLALAATLARVFFIGDVLDAGVDFLLLLIVQRLFNRQKAREHMQLLMLGSLLMVVGAVVNTGLTYPLLFAAYTVIAVMTLVVNHLMAEGERLGPRVMADMARAAMRSRAMLWRAAAGVAALAGVGALLVFLLFPRWGAGVFLRGAFARDTRSGFSGEVALGEFGRIKSDATVAARLRPKTPMPTVQRLTWHLRGGAFDVYQDGRWSNDSSKAERVPLRGVGGYRALAPDKQPLLTPVRGRSPGKLSVQYRAAPNPFLIDGRQVHVEVLLEDLGVDAMFVASDPIAVRLAPRGALEQRDLKVRAGMHRTFRIDKPPGPVQYEFVAQLGDPDVAALQRLGDPDVPEDFEGYLRRTEGLSAQVGALAQRVVGDADNRYDKVALLMEHLRGFDYTTDLQPSQRVVDGADPIEGFLFDTKAGHCEYFATALAVLGREVGVPTRLVNGYYGAHYNTLGEFYAVRQADAHSWVEVWFGPEAGWVTFDPTPPSGRTAGDDAPIFPALDEAFDALRNAYLEYVIDYNLSKQMGLLRNLGMSRGDRHPRIDWRGVGTWFGVFAVAGLGAWWWRRRRRPKLPDTQRLYEDVLRALARLGFERSPSESPTRFARRIAPELDDAAPLVRFAERYEAARFGRGTPDTAALRTHAAAAKKVRPKA
ncbi:MAG: DUF3488 and DUF4129 domain-containing transglutaminase family protein [Nannocystaceae bacterium]|nr:DUF3488 and transglutaminase-like domain-containing protein [bacterium]